MVHSVGAGIFMLFCREFRKYIRYKKGVKRIFLFGADGPPLPIFILLISEEIISFFSVLKKA